MVLATYALGYNILLGYTGLLEPRPRDVLRRRAVRRRAHRALSRHRARRRHSSLGALAGLVFASAVGLVALRTTGVAFMIVTMMFAQACFLLTLYFSDFTRGDEGHRAAPKPRGSSAASA